MAAQVSDAWESVTQVDLVAQLPMLAMIQAQLPVLATVYQCSPDSEYGELTARGWAALLSVEVSR